MKVNRRKICVFTGTRAEYGLLKPLMDEIQKHNEFLLQICASGMHLSPEFGYTYRMIENDGFEINEKIEILLSSDSSVGIAKAMGLGLISYSEALLRLNPDIVLLVGDRFEGLAMAQACLFGRIPIAHLHGGEATLGAMDESIRHSITKMSHLHFTSCNEYRKRVVQLGEHPDRVYNVGAIGVEALKKTTLMSREHLEEDIGFELGEQFFMVTYHPVTLECEAANKQFENLLDTLYKFFKTSDKLVKIIFTKANADIEGRVINKLIDGFVCENPNNSIGFTSMGQLRYLSAAKHASAIVGNSSSGILEAPSLKTPTVNIGDRQLGRIQAENVINCIPEQTSIQAALEKAVSSEFIKSLKNMKNPYEKDGTTKRIISVLRNADLRHIIKKEFYKIECNYLAD